MPAVIRCPNCNAPLDKAPGGDAAKCPYCGATLVATRWMPSPVGPPVQVPPEAPPPGVPAALQQVIQAATQAADRQLQARRRIGLIVTLAVVGVLAGAGAVVFLTVSKAVDEATTTVVTTSAGTGGVPVALPPVTIGPGVPAVTNFEGPSPDTLESRYTLEVPAPGPWEVSFAAGSPAADCTAETSGVSGEAVRSGTGATGQIRAVLGQGTRTISLRCGNVGSSLEVLARPVPRLELATGKDQAGEGSSIETGTTEAGAVFVADRAGDYALVAATDTSGTLSLHGPDDAPLEVASVDSSSEQAVILRTLAAGEYRLLFAAGYAPTERTPITFSAFRDDAVPLEPGTDVRGMIPRQQPRGSFALTLAEPARLRLRVTSPARRVEVSIVRADGIAVVEPETAYESSPADIATEEPLPAGTYRVVVRPDDPGVATLFTVRAKLLTGELEPLESDEADEQQSLEGCDCRAAIDGGDGTETLELAAGFAGSSLTIENGTQRRENHFAWSLAVGSRLRLGFPAREGVAPPRTAEGGALGIGVACAPNVFVVAGGEYVSAWSPAEGKLLWTAALDGRYPRGESAGEGVNIRCGRLRVSGGAVRVSLEGGGSATVNMADGSIR
jgi:hypothetical protein